MDSDIFTSFIIFKCWCLYATHTSDMIHVRVQLNYKKYGILYNFVPLQILLLPSIIG